MAPTLILPVCLPSGGPSRPDSGLRPGDLPWLPGPSQNRRSRDVESALTRAHRLAAFGSLSPSCEADPAALPGHTQSLCAPAYACQPPEECPGQGWISQPSRQQTQACESPAEPSHETQSRGRPPAHRAKRKSCLQALSLGDTFLGTLDVG